MPKSKTTNTKSSSPKRTGANRFSAVKASTPSERPEPGKAWCVHWREDDGDRHKTGWCALASQPKDHRSAPKYRDQVRTRCKKYVVYPGPLEYREPTCEDCTHR